MIQFLEHLVKLVDFKLSLMINPTRRVLTEFLYYKCLSSLWQTTRG